MTFYIDLDEDGNVADLRIIESVPEGVFDKEAIKSVKQWEFAPVTQPVTIQQKIEFALEKPSVEPGNGVYK